MSNLQIRNNGFTEIEFVLSRIEARLPATVTLLDPETGIWLTARREQRLGDTAQHWYGMLSTNPDEWHARSLEFLWLNRRAASPGESKRWSPASVVILPVGDVTQEEIDGLLDRNQLAWQRALAVSRLAQEFERNSQRADAPRDFEERLLAWLWFSCPAYLRTEVEAQIGTWNSDEAKAARAEAYS